MVRLKYVGFVSNEYVIVNTVILLFQTLLISAALFLSSAPTVIAVMLPLVFFVIVSFDQYKKAPLAYKRVKMDSQGIRVGDVEIKYEDIYSISVSRGCVQDWFGFRFLENLLGINQHFDIHLEDMICINCIFSDFSVKKGKFPIYVPRNSQTSMLLKKYCSIYDDGNYVECTKTQKKTKKEIVNDILIYSVVPIAFIIIVILLRMELMKTIALSVLICLFVGAIYLKYNSHRLICIVVAHIHRLK